MVILRRCGETSPIQMHNDFIRELVRVDGLEKINETLLPKVLT
ncbi:hypothetical protein QE439_004113 [Pedobacter agri]|nr:hypothetical protein [Pedobacter agri]